MCRDVIVVFSVDLDSPVIKYMIVCSAFSMPLSFSLRFSLHFRDEGGTLELAVLGELLVRLNHAVQSARALPTVQILIH